jgi:curli biogenesis system outer membrane secretion channel CsgG
MNPRFRTTATRILAALLVVTAPALAAAAKKEPKETKEEKLKKPRMAILHFPAASGAWGCGGWANSEHRMSDVLRDLFTTAISEKAKGKIRLIERERLNDIRNELSFEQSGEVDGATAQKIGKLLGVRYMLTGKMTRFACKKSGVSSGWGIGSVVGKLTGSSMAGAVAGSANMQKVKFSGRLDVRLIDVQSGEILSTFKDEEETGDTSVKIAGGGTEVDYDDELANKVFEPIVERMTPKIVKKTQVVHEENLAEDAEDDSAPPPPKKVAAVAKEEPAPAKPAPAAAKEEALAPVPVPGGEVKWEKVPGLYWEQTMAGKMSGTISFNMPAKTSKVCQPKEGFKTPPKSGDDCQFTEMKRSSSKMTWKMTCKNGTSGEGEMTFTPETYTGWMSMTTPAGDMKFDVSGKKLGGDCQATVPKQ